MSWVNDKTDTEKLVEICKEMCEILQSTPGNVSPVLADPLVKLAVLSAEQSAQRATKILKLADLEIAIKQINDIV